LDRLEASPISDGLLESASVGERAFSLRKSSRLGSGKQRTAPLLSAEPTTKMEKQEEVGMHTESEVISYEE
jgi:hypothetical protein